MNKAAKKLTGALLAGLLGASFLTGCSKTVDGTKPLLTSGEDTVTVGTGNLMLRMNQATMLSYYSMMGASTSGIWSQDAGDGETYGDTTKENVLDELENIVRALTGRSELDVERRKQKAIEKWDDTRTNEELFRQLKVISVQKKKAGIDFLTWRSICEILNLPGKSRDNFIKYLEQHHSRQFVPPLWQCSV